MIRLETGRGHLTVPVAEGWVARLAAEVETGRSVTLDLSSCRTIDSGAGWRLGNALRRFGAPHGACDAVVELPADNFAGSWYLNYTRTGLGQALARYARSVIDIEGRDRTREVRDYYEKQDHYDGNNFKAVFGTARIQTLVPDEETFNAQFKEWLEQVLTNKDADEAVVAQSLSLLAWEAVTNVVDHSSKAPLDSSTRTLASFSIRWYPAARPASSPRQAQWQSAAARSKPGQDLVGYLHIVVTDDGVGVAARQSLDSSVYDGPWASEFEALSRALEAGSTVKLASGDAEIRGTPGYGFTYISQTVRALNAWANLRTGRIALEFDGTNADSSGFVPWERELGYLPGTTLEVTIPIHSAQLELPLSGNA